MKILIPFFAHVCLSIGSMVLSPEVYEFSSKITLITALCVAIWILLKKFEQVEEKLYKKYEESIESHNVSLKFFKDSTMRELDNHKDEKKDFIQKWVNTESEKTKISNRFIQVLEEKNKIEMKLRELEFSINQNNLKNA